MSRSNLLLVAHVRFHDRIMVKGGNLHLFYTSFGKLFLLNMIRKRFMISVPFVNDINFNVRLFISIILWSMFFLYNIKFILLGYYFETFSHKCQKMSFNACYVVSWW